jgi:hypothetical protein
MNYRAIFCFLFSTFFSCSATAQQTEIKGRLINLNNKNVVAFAEVCIDSTNVCTISNNNGEFCLRIPASFSKKTISIIAAGYKKTGCSLKTYNADNAIELKPVQINIHHVTTTNESAISILQRALVKTNLLNYNQPINYTGLLCDEEKDNNILTYNAQAVVKLYNCYDKKQAGIKVITARGNCFEKQYQRTYDNGFFVSLYDLHNNTALFSESFFDMKHFKEFNYTLDGIKLFGNDSVYVISFASSNKYSKNDKIKGSCYIEIHSMAIEGYVFKAISQISELQDFTEHTTAIYFKKYDDKWHFSRSFFSNAYTHGHQQGYYQSTFTVFKTSIINPEIIVPSASYNIKDEKNKFKYILTNYNDPFWKDYAFLKTRKY